jgi:hypothetical protein
VGALRGLPHRDSRTAPPKSCPRPPRSRTGSWRDRWRGSTRSTPGARREAKVPAPGRASGGILRAACPDNAVATRHGTRATVPCTRSRSVAALEDLTPRRAEQRLPSTTAQRRWRTPIPRWSGKGRPGRSPRAGRPRAQARPHRGSISGAMAGHGGGYAGAWRACRRCIGTETPSHPVLQTVIREHLETLVREATERGDGSGLPRFVEEESRECLTCGILAHGFARCVSS